MEALEVVGGPAALEIAFKLLFVVEDGVASSDESRTL